MGIPGPQKIHRYGIAFKLRAVQMSNQPGVLIKDVAESLCIHPFMLSRWLFVQTAVRHLKPQGILLVERHDPEWLRTATVGPVGESGSVKTYLESVDRVESAVKMRLRY